MQNIQQTFAQYDLGDILISLIGALVILIVGYLVAKLVEYLVRKGLSKTTLDDRIARSVSGDEVDVPKMERYIAAGVFWLIMIFVLVAFFQTLNLTFVTEPLNRFLGTVLEYIPQLIAAGALLFVAWVVASLLRMLTRRALEAGNVDRHVNERMEEDRKAVQGGSPPRPKEPSRPSGAGTPSEPGTRSSGAGAEGMSVSESLSTAVYYLVFLLFLPAILSTLELEGLLGPVESMVNELLDFLPNLLAAALIGVIGYFIARLIRSIVISLSSAAGIDRLAERLGISEVLGQKRLSQVLGVIVYVLVLIPVIVAALNALQLDAITEPASDMLNLILAAIPQIFAAALVLVIAYVVGKLVAGLISNLLASIGFNRMMARAGLASEQSATAETAGTATSGRTPADVAGSLVLAGIMLFAAMEAANLLGFEALTLLLADFLVFAGQIIIGLIVFAVGLYLANLAYRAVSSSDMQQAELMAVVARVAILVLAGAMALRQMGLANSIINLAFGLVLGAVAVAAAIAFGLGGRDFAQQQLKKLQSSGGQPPEALKPSQDAPGMERGPEKEMDPKRADTGDPSKSAPGSKGPSGTGPSRETPREGGTGPSRPPRS